MWEWVQVVGTSGGAAAVLWTIWRFHLSAVRAHNKRADGWERAYTAERAVSRELQLQNALLVQRLLSADALPAGGPDSITR